MTSSAQTCANRVAVVTGSNQGIGYFVALQLGLSGKFGHVILACRDATRGQEAVANIQKDFHSSSSSAANGVTFAYEPLTLGDSASHQSFAQKMEQTFGKVDVLINNAAMAFKGADPTPFQQQCRPTLDVNFRGTVDFTEHLLPLLRKGDDPRIVNVASGAGRLGQVSQDLQAKFSNPNLEMSELHALVDKFQHDVENGIHVQEGWSNSNYGISKLAVIAATKIWARQEHGTVVVNCCCPGYCATSMSSYKGGRPPEEGAKNAVIPATMENPPTGSFFSNFQVAEW